MRRREFITVVGGAAAWPLASRAQQAAMPVIGYLNPTSPERGADGLRAFRQGLSEIGYVEGRNVAVEYRWAEDKNDRLPALAADLARLQVAVIMAYADVSALASKAATTTIPIVFVSGNNPVDMGLVADLNRPGGNLTGVTTLNVAMAAKRLQLLHEVVPAATSIAALLNPTDPTFAVLSRDLPAAASTLGVTLHILNAGTVDDFDAVFATLMRMKIGALAIGGDPFFNTQMERLAALTVRYAMPAIYQYRPFVAAGGLMSYGSPATEPSRLAGAYVGRILKGEKPADLPVQQAVKVEFILNLRTAKALGLTIPLPLSGRADEVIE